jgi:choline dehydrogenase-like flavoprotein
MKAIYVVHIQTEVLPVLVYTRAAASDYDDWKEVYGNKGWDSEHLIPLLKRVESFTICLLQN